jgi:Protein of unknown function (DUF2637)
MTDRLITVTTALAIVAVAAVAAIISYQHAYELVSSHGEHGVTARLLPFTVDGLIWAASMVVLDASRRNNRVPRLAAWSLGVGIVATAGANLAHGLGHGPAGAVVSAWQRLRPSFCVITYPASVRLAMMPWARRSVMPRLAAMSRSLALGSWAMCSRTRAGLVRKPHSAT